MCDKKGRAPIGVRWVDVDKGSGVQRSRLVAKDFRPWSRVNDKEEGMRSCGGSGPEARRANPRRHGDMEMVECNGSSVLGVKLQGEDGDDDEFRGLDLQARASGR